jgi:hypothetical protein
MLRKTLIVSLLAYSVSIVIVLGQGSSVRIIGQETDYNPIVTAVPFLSITPDARAAGLGEAGVASSPDANSSYWNMSKLAFIDKRMGASISYTPWLSKIVNDMSISYLSGYYKLNSQQVISLSMRYFNLGSMDFTNDQKQIIRQVRPNEFSLDAGFAMKLSKKFSMGVTGRYIYSNLAGNVSTNALDSRPGQSAAADISAYYTTATPLLGRPGNFSWGVNVSNIGAKISYSNDTQTDFLPTNLRVGTAFTSELDPYNKLTLLFDVNKLLVPTPAIYDDQGRLVSGIDSRNSSMLTGVARSFVDAPGGAKEELREIIYCTGLEYWYNNTFAVRGGYFHESQYKGNRQYYTLGLGLRYTKFGLDFAYLVGAGRQNPLEDTVRFSLFFNLDEKKEVSDENLNPDEL